MFFFYVELKNQSTLNKLIVTVCPGETGICDSVNLVSSSHKETKAAYCLKKVLCDNKNLVAISYKDKWRTLIGLP